MTRHVFQPHPVTTLNAPQRWPLKPCRNLSREGASRASLVPSRPVLKGDRAYLRALRAAEMVSWQASGGDALNLLDRPLNSNHTGGGLAGSKVTLAAAPPVSPLGGAHERKATLSC